MKKPENFRELFKLVSPRDLYEVLCFSGINDNRNEEHRKIRRKLQDKVYKSIYYKRFSDEEDYCYYKEPKLLGTKMEDIHYEIIVESLQDFYYWSHQFNHIHAHIFLRVLNALEIPISDMYPIMKLVKKNF